jgi:hypothetical protein
MKKIVSIIMLIITILLFFNVDKHSNDNFKTQTLYYDEQTKILTHCYHKLNFCQSEFYESRRTEIP